MFTLVDPTRLTYGIIDLLFNLSDLITRKKDLSFGIGPVPRESEITTGQRID